MRVCMSLDIASLLIVGVCSVLDKRSDPRSYPAINIKSLQEAYFGREINTQISWMIIFHPRVNVFGVFG